MDLNPSNPRDKKVYSNEKERERSEEDFESIIYVTKWITTWYSRNSKEVERSKKKIKEEKDLLKFIGEKLKRLTKKKSMD